MLGTMVDNQKANWNNHINNMRFAYNCTKNESTGFSLFEVLFGRAPRLPIDIIFWQYNCMYLKAIPTVLEKMNSCNDGGSQDCSCRNRPLFFLRIENPTTKDPEVLLLSQEIEYW